MAVPKPAWDVVGADPSNFWHGTRKRAQAIVCHIMDGSLDGCITWFNTPNAKGSANFGVGKSGRIVCFIDPFGSNSPFANGLLDQQDDSVNKLLAANPPHTNPNDITWSIEHEGKSGNAFTPAQLAASAQLCAYLLEQAGIPFDEDHILGHYEFDNVTRHNCPGWDRAQWIAYEAAVSGWLSPEPPHHEPDVAAALTALLALKRVVITDTETVLTGATTDAVLHVQQFSGDVTSGLDHVVSLLQPVAAIEGVFQFAREQAGEQPQE